MSIMQFLMGTPARVEQLPRYTSEQQNVLSQLLGMGLSGMQNPYSGFDAIENNARQNFYQQTIPTIAERFTSHVGGALSSPAFASQLGQSGANLESNLAAQRSQYGMQNRSQLMQLLGMGLAPQFENMPMGQQPGLAQQALPGLGRLGVGLASAYIPGLSALAPLMLGGR